MEAAEEPGKALLLSIVSLARIPHGEKVLLRTLEMLFAKKAVPSTSSEPDSRGACSTSEAPPRLNGAHPPNESPTPATPSGSPSTTDSFAFPEQVEKGQRGPTSDSSDGERRPKKPCHTDRAKQKMEGLASTQLQLQERQQQSQA